MVLIEAMIRQLWTSMNKTYDCTVELLVMQYPAMNSPWRKVWLPGPDVPCSQSCRNCTTQRSRTKPHMRSWLLRNDSWHAFLMTKQRGRGWRLLSCSGTSWQRFSFFECFYCSSGKLAINLWTVFSKETRLIRPKFRFKPRRTANEKGLMQWATGGLGWLGKYCGAMSRRRKRPPQMRKDFRRSRTGLTLLMPVNDSCAGHVRAGCEGC